MPIYMDLHDNDGITAEAAAEAHLKDVKIQSKYKCKFITSGLMSLAIRVFACLKHRMQMR